MRRLLLVAAAAALLVAPVARAWTWPASGGVLQPFTFDPDHPYAGGQHRGIDVAAAGGEDVRAPASGTVTFAGSVPGSGSSVTITTPDGLAVTLTHLGSIAVAEHAAVAEGDTVGTVGPSGDAEVDGPYVHLGIRVAADPQGYRDPLVFLPARAAAAPPAAAPEPAPAPAPLTSSAPVPAPAPAPAPAALPPPPATAAAGTVATPAPAPGPPPNDAPAPAPAAAAAAEPLAEVVPPPAAAPIPPRLEPAGSRSPPGLCARGRPSRARGTRPPRRRSIPP